MNLNLDKIDKVGNAAGLTAQVGGGAYTVGHFFDWIGTAQGSFTTGVAIALLGLLVSTYFSWRRDRREERVARAEELAAQAAQRKAERPTRPAPLDFYG